MEKQRLASPLTREEVPCSTDRTAGNALSRDLVEALTSLDPVVFWLRFWARVTESEAIAPGEKTPCLIWTGSKTGYGYGEVTFGTRPRTRLLAHRVAYVYLYGDLADGDDLLHGPCNNRLCLCHTRIGTQAANMRDAAERGRAHGSSTENNRRIGYEAASQARARVAAGETAAAVARSLGVTASAIYHIVAGRYYRDPPASVLR